jgi:hypothetical protein
MLQHVRCLQSRDDIAEINAARRFTANAGNIENGRLVEVKHSSGLANDGMGLRTAKLQRDLFGN